MKNISIQLHALANPVRIKIMRLLLTGELNVGLIQAEIGGSQPALSQHLKTLFEAKLVSRRRNGRHIFYMISNPHVSTLLQTAERMSVYL